MLLFILQNYGPEHFPASNDSPARFRHNAQPQIGNSFQKTICSPPHKLLSPAPIVLGAGQFPAPHYLNYLSVNTNTFFNYLYNNPSIHSTVNCVQLLPYPSVFTHEIRGGIGIPTNRTCYVQYFQTQQRNLQLMPQFTQNINYGPLAIESVVNPNVQISSIELENNHEFVSGKGEIM